MRPMSGSVQRGSSAIVYGRFYLATIARSFGRAIVSLVVFAGCGGDSDRASSDLALRPFPYVVNNCVETDDGWTFQQQLRIRQPDGSEVVAKEVRPPVLQGIANIT